VYCFRVIFAQLDDAFKALLVHIVSTAADEATSGRTRLP